MQASYLNVFEARVSSCIVKHFDKVFHSILLLHRCSANRDWYLVVVQGRKKSNCFADDSDNRDRFNCFSSLDIRKSVDVCSRMDCFLGNLFCFWNGSRFRIRRYNVASNRSDYMRSVDGFLYWPLFGSCCDSKVCRLAKLCKCTDSSTFYATICDPFYSIV